MQNTPIQQQDQTDLVDLNAANMTIAGYDGAEPNHPRFLSGVGGQCTSLLQCDGLYDCCFGLQSHSGFGRCQPSCESTYQSTCGHNNACAIGLACINSYCIYPNKGHTYVNGHVQPQAQLAYLTRDLHHNYYNSKATYNPTIKERAREYELNEQANLLQRIETAGYGEIDYAYVQAKLGEIEREKHRLELEQRQKTVEQSAVKQEYLNEVRKEQIETQYDINERNAQLHSLNQQEHRVAGNGVPPGNVGSAGAGVNTPTSIGTGYYGTGVYPNQAHAVGYGVHDPLYNSQGLGYKAPHGVNHGTYNPNNQFYDRLKAAVNVQPSYTYLNTENGGDSDEIAGIPVGGFIGIIAGVLVLCVIAACLVRYIFFPRKFQRPEDLEMEYGPESMGGQSDIGASMSNMSPRMDHMKAANADVFASNTSMEPKIPGQQYN